MGQDVAFGNLHLHTELFSHELAGFRLIELVGESDRAIALGPFEGLHQLLTMLRDILRKRLPGRSLKRHHDLRRSRDIILHTGRSRRKGGIDEHFEDIAVIDNRTFEPRFRELHHVEQRFPFVQIGIGANSTERSVSPKSLSHNCWLHTTINSYGAPERF